MKNQAFRTLLASVLLVSILSIPAFAATSTQTSQETPIPQSSSEDIAPYKDELIYHYRIYQGVKQYRIWNATKGIWMNDWTNIRT